MGRRTFLLSVVFGMGLALVNPMPAAASNSCSSASVYLGTCDAVVSGGGVDLSGESSSGGGSDAGAGVPDPGAGLECEGLAGCGVDRPLDFVVIAPPNVTLDDIVRFVPESGAAGMEPSGWIVVGLPTNFFADASRHVQAGIVLEQPAEVRFTPTSFTWDYGDGTSQTVAAPGDTWANLGLAEFSATEAGHTFVDAGPFTIRLVVAYSAEYRFGAGPFLPLAGSVPASTLELVALAGDAQTVLVGGQCSDSRRGPGC